MEGAPSARAMVCVCACALLGSESMRVGCLKYTLHATGPSPEQVEASLLADRLMIWNGSHFLDANMGFEHAMLLNTFQNMQAKNV